MALKIWTLLALSFTFCTTKVLVDQSSSGKSVTDSTALQRQNRLLGAWTDGNSDNATFWIDNDSIHYVEHFNGYKYRLHSDSIEINYTDMMYFAAISYNGDTLIWTSDHDSVKFWPFTN
ncbi:MAG: hypothetical protein PSX36_10195 [bacterium]|nr:hypothetical protein [bacterium]